MSHREQSIVEPKCRELARQSEWSRRLKSWILLTVLCLLFSGCSTGNGQSVLTSSSDSFYPVGRFEKAEFGDGSIVGHIGGPATSIQVTDNTAYLGHSREFAVIDLSNPASPVRVGYLLLSALDMVLDGETAYVAGRDGLAIVDVSIPADPRMVSFVPTEHSSIGIAKEGDTVYLAVHMEGLHTVDVSDGNRPMRTSIMPIDSRVSGVAVHDRHAYVMTNFGFQIIDVSNKKSPVFIGEFETDRPALSITVNGDVAYVGISEGILALDIAEPANPFEIERISLAGTPLRLKVSDDVLYSAASDGLVAIDLPRPVSHHSQEAVTDARFLGEPTWIDVAGASWDVATVGEYAYIADGTSGMRSVALNSPFGSVTSEFKEVGAYAVPNAVRSVSIDSDLAYVVDGRGDLWTIDVASPIIPATQKRWISPYYVHDVFVTQETIYLSASQGGHNLRTVSASHIQSHCRDAAMIDTMGFVTHVSATENVLYLATQDAGLQVVDIRQPCRPQNLGTIRIPGRINDMVIIDGFVDDLVYLAVEGDAAGESGGILVFDISEPTAVSLISTVVLDEPLVAIAIRGDHLYGASLSGTLTVMESGPRARVRAVKSIDIQEEIYDMTLALDRLYLATSAGVQIYEIDEAANLRLDALHNVPGGVEAIDVDNGVVYAAAGITGLYIIQTESVSDDKIAALTR